MCQLNEIQKGRCHLTFIVVCVSFSQNFVTFLSYLLGETVCLARPTKYTSVRLPNLQSQTKANRNQFRYTHPTLAGIDRSPRRTTLILTVPQFSMTEQETASNSISEVSLIGVPRIPFSSRRCCGDSPTAPFSNPVVSCS